ncbi:putative thiolase [Citreicella sp. 357]|nr:putative thiolase [Citreicella sp. 357]
MPRKKHTARITGVADTAMGELPGSTALGLHAEATNAALKDAGLKAQDIDGVLCGYSMTVPHLMLSSVFSEYYGISPSFNTAIQAGGATACIMLANAVALVESGACRHVLCVTGDNRLTGMTRDGAVAALATVGHPEFEQPYGMSVPASYALVAQAYMHRYGITRDALSAIAVSARKHAARHPKATKRDPLTLTEVSESRVIASPLRLLDCCLISDGGAAVIVSAADAARDTRNPVRVLGSGQGHTHEHIMAAPSLTDFGCKASSAMAFAQAGVTAQDIDVAEIYDSFTITLLAELESIGFFEKGEAGKAALAGELSQGGRLPTNTHGGLMSYGHSGAAGGAFHIVEAVHQLRGEADARQVPGAQLSFVHGDGGILSAHCSLVLGKD